MKHAITQLKHNQQQRGRAALKLSVNTNAQKKKRMQDVLTNVCVCDQLRVRDLEVALTAERSGHQEAQSDRELLRAKFREVERAYALERERSVGTERALER